LREQIKRGRLARCRDFYQLVFEESHCVDHIFRTRSCSRRATPTDEDHQERTASALGCNQGDGYVLKKVELQSSARPIALQGRVAKVDWGGFARLVTIQTWALTSLGIVGRVH